MNNSIKKELSKLENIETIDNYSIFGYDMLSNFDVEILREIKNNFHNEINLEKALFKSIYLGDFYFFKKLFDIGFGVDYRDFRGINFLMESCRRDNYEMSKFLIENGVDINHKDKHQNTAFYIACTFNSYECAKLLISYGVDINEEDIDGSLSPLGISKLLNNKKIVDLLIENGASE